MSLLPHVAPGSDPDGPRARPLIFSFGTHFNGSQQAIIDNDWKILTRPSIGQCDQQPGFNFSLARGPRMFLYNLRNDVHETTDLAMTEPEVFAKMSKMIEEMRASIMHSRVQETRCEAGV